MAADLYEQDKSIVLGNVRMLRTTETMEIYAVCLLPPSIPKSPIEPFYDTQRANTLLSWPPFWESKHTQIN